MLRVLLPLLSLLSSPVLAQGDAPAPPKPACATPIVPTGALAAWANATPLVASGEGGSAPELAAGKTVAVALLPTPQVHFVATPKKAGGPEGFSGLLAFEVKQAGTYRIALGAAAWLDVVSPEGAALTSLTHSHGPDCSGIRKMVDFELTKGRHTIQIAGAPVAQAKLLISGPDRR